MTPDSNTVGFWITWFILLTATALLVWWGEK